MLIDNYDPKSEGIMVLITESNANATWFVTIKLKSKSKRWEINPQSKYNNMMVDGSKARHTLEKAYLNESF